MGLFHKHAASVLFFVPTVQKEIVIFMQEKITISFWAVKK